MAWFHGGKPGLAVGDIILPPTESGADMLAKYGEDDAPEHRRVYITRDPRYAATYACSFPRGDLYEVEPLGKRGNDETYFIAGLSQWCERARVTRVTRRNVRLVNGKLTR